MNKLQFIFLCIVLGVVGSVQAICIGNKAGPRCSSKWNVENLIDQVSFHDGPNCFNAALAGAGLMNDLMYVDTAEFRYYFESFCKLQVRSLPGDLLVYLGLPGGRAEGEQDSKPIVVHGAINVGGGLIFEKTSTSGVLFNKTIKGDLPGVYRVKQMEDSPFALNETGATKKIHAYRCEFSPAVRAKFAETQSVSTALLINKLRRQIAIQNRQSSQVKIAHLKEPLIALGQKIAALHGDKESDLYIWSISRSLIGAIGSASEETQEIQYEEGLTLAIDQFREKIFELAFKISSQAESLRVRRILD